MALTELNTYTINDIYNLPDGQRAELIDGRVYYMAPATRNHQRIVGELFATIREHIRRNNAKGEVDIAPFGVFVDADDKSYVEPDICIICDENKLDDKGCNGAPDWVIEITSASNSRYDYITKMIMYQKSGVREYWIIDPAEEKITVLNFENPFGTGEYSFVDGVVSGIFENLVIRIKDFMEDE